MFKGKRVHIRLVLFAVALAISGGVLAQDMSGLGQSWPNATDQSRTAGLHAYRWDKDGVEYVQVNAANGDPLVAVAVAGGVVLVLPIGDPSVVSVATPDAAASTAAATVYSDTAVTVQATATGYQVAPAAAPACSDPADCTRPPAAQATPLSTMSAATCTDPADCTRIN